MTSQSGQTHAIEHSVRVPASREVVFEYFTDPAKLVRWMGDEAVLDPRPGGTCRLVINGVTMIGRFVEVEFPTRLVFTWGWKERFLELPPQTTEVAVSLERDGDGTLVRLAHRRLPASAVAFHSAGWRQYLRRLTDAAGGLDPGPDECADLGVVARAIAAEAGPPRD